MYFQLQTLYISVWLITLCNICKARKISAALMLAWPTMTRQLTQTTTTRKQLMTLTSTRDIGQVAGHVIGHWLLMRGTVFLHRHRAHRAWLTLWVAVVHWWMPTWTRYDTRVWTTRNWGTTRHRWGNVRSSTPTVQWFIGRVRAGRTWTRVT